MAQGFTRFRKIQVGKQSVIATAVPATRVLPYQSLVVYQPNRTDPSIDVGALDLVIAPYPVAPTVTLPGAAGPLTFDDLAVRASAGIKGGVSPTGNAVSGFTWTFQASSLTADPFDYYSVQTGDDTADGPGAGTNAYGAVINQFSQSMAEGLDPWTVSDDWIAASAVYGNRTGSLTVNNNLDQKRFADGSNVRFALSAFGRGQRDITLDLVVEKTTATIAEATTLNATPTPNRYIKISTNSLENAGSGGTKASADFYLPVRLYDVTDGAIANNTNWTLHYKGFYDSTLGYAIKVVVVNSLSALP